MSKGTEQFSLVFEGPVDDAPETLRKLKSALLVDLCFSIERIQEILTKTPYTLITTSEEEDLSRYLELIALAGGKATIVKQVQEEMLYEEGEGFDLSIQFNDEEPVAAAPQPAVEEHFDLSLHPLDDQVIEETVEPQAILQSSPTLPITEISTGGLSFDDAEELPSPPVEASVEQKVETETQPQPETKSDRSTESSPPAQEETVEFSFSFEDEEEEKKKVEIPPKKTKTYELPPEEDLTTEIPQMLEKEPVGPIVSLLAKSREKKEEDFDLTIDALKEEKLVTPESVDTKIEPESQEAHSEPEAPPPLKVSASSSGKKKIKRSVRSESVAHSTEDQPEPEQQVKSKSGKKSWRNLLKHELFIPVCVGSVTILIANWAYFTYLTEPESSDISSMIKSISQVAIPVAPEPKEEPTPILHPLTGHYTGVQDYGNRKITFDVQISIENRKASVKILTETPEPPQLTLQQIGRQEKRPIWVRSVEMEQQNVEITNQGVFDGTAPAFIYLEDNGFSKRLPGTGSVSGKIDAEAQKISITITGRYGSPPSNSDLMVRPKGEQEYDFIVSGEGVAHKAN